MLVQCWANICDTVQTLIQQWHNTCKHISHLYHAPSLKARLAQLLMIESRTCILKQKNALVDIISGKTTYTSN